MPISESTPLISYNKINKEDYSLKNGKLFIFNIVTAYGNKGDLLINRALIENLRNFGRVAVVTEHLPSHFLFELGLNEDEKCKTFGTCISQNLFRYTIYKVGIPGHSFENEPQFLSACKELIITAVFKYIFRFNFLRVGTSFGPTHKFKLKIEKIKAEMYLIYGLRDDSSVKLCSPSKMLYFPDLAFISSDIIKSDQENSDEGYYFLSFRAKFPEAAILDVYMTKIITKLEVFLKKSKIKSIVIGYQVSEDKETSMKINSVLSRNKNLNIKFIDELLELQDSMLLISGASLVISNRLHVLLPSLIAGVPHIALTDMSRHQKISALYETIGAQFATHDITTHSEMEVVCENSPENLISIAQEQRKLALDILQSTIV